MTDRSAEEILAAEGGLVVFAQGRTRPEIYLIVDREGITGFNGHVDLGTGIRTALAQFVAEELDVAFDRVRMVLGSVSAGPDQGPTVASTTIQVTSLPLRRAAAQARHALIGIAAEMLGIVPEDLTIENGVVRETAGGNRGLSFDEVLNGRTVRLELDPEAPLKDKAAYRVIGKSVRRVDIADKAAGRQVYVHDMRLPGMLHGRVVRPPYGGQDSGPHVGTSLRHVDRSSIAHVPGVVDVVVQGDFVGVVAEREEYAIMAANALRVEWAETPPLRDLGDVRAALRGHESARRVLEDRGDVEAALAAADQRFSRSYVWPYQMHGSIGPSCALAKVGPDGVTIWSGTQSPHILKGDIALLLDLPEDRVDIRRMEASGCYGRNCADDVAADAALLSAATGCPVRVQLTREQEHVWEPKGAAQLVDVEGGLDAAGNVVAYDFETRYPSNMAPTLALILTGKVPNVSEAIEAGDRTAVPPYDYENMRIVCEDMSSIVRAAWLRGVSALPNTFAHESFIDEMAMEAGVDPVEFRLRYLRDPRAIDVLKAAADEAGWQPRTRPRLIMDEDGMLRGQGVAYAVYVHSAFPGFNAAWSAWVADVAVNPRSGEVLIDKVVVSQDTGLMINPDGVRHQLEGNVVQSISRALKEEVSFDRNTVREKEWGSYPITTFPELPALQSVLLSRPEEPPMGAGESASVPSAAAIANAIFDATGVRFREVPFTPEKVRDALHSDPEIAGMLETPEAPKRRRRRSLWAAVAGGMVALGGAVMTPAAIPPTAGPVAGLYSAETIERGRILAALGNCVECHTAEGGIALAGGYVMETPFGAITAPNITPDMETGIGGWSFEAFDRAMRQGIGRDGRHLYPAFPYASFTHMDDADMQALYAYLMNVEPVTGATSSADMPFPFNQRRLLAGWNALYANPAPLVMRGDRSALWNRGRYLVEGIAHCGECHSPRNAFGAQRRGGAYLSGGVVRGWDAPSLAGTGTERWTAGDFFTYLRTGHSSRHGVATGPMAAVVGQLQSVPDADIEAMSVYLASLGAGQEVTAPLAGATERLFDGACGVCHVELPGPALFGSGPDLGDSSKLRADRPDNLIRVIMEGIPTPSIPALGAMPEFGSRLTDGQIAELVEYLRARYAPERPAWTDVGVRVGAIRLETATMR